jgi:hypothetical protein
MFPAKEGPFSAVVAMVIFPYIAYVVPSQAAIAEAWPTTAAAIAAPRGTLDQQRRKEMGGNTLATSSPMTKNSLQVGKKRGVGEHRMAKETVSLNSHE